MSSGLAPASMAAMRAFSCAMVRARASSTYFFPFGFATGVRASASSGVRVATGMP